MFDDICICGAMREDHFDGSPYTDGHEFVTDLNAYIADVDGLPNAVDYLMCEWWKGMPEGAKYDISLDVIRA